MAEQETEFNWRDAARVMLNRAEWEQAIKQGNCVILRREPKEYLTETPAGWMLDRKPVKLVTTLEEALAASHK